MIGLIFGETFFPREILKKVKKRKIKYLIIDLTNGRFKNDKHSHKVSIGQFGKIIKILKDNRCKKVLFAGKVKKPNFSKLRLDFKGIYYIRRIIKSSKLGDAAILKEIIKILKDEILKLEKEEIIPHGHIVLRRGAGAYICGEESAMIESIEGKRGLPRHRPPYVAEVGLFNSPTLTNNLETLFWIRDILEKGPNWFADKGIDGNKGFHSFSVSGRVKNPGVKVAPAGITIQELIDDYCGGMEDNHVFKGYLPGGASGGILPSKMNNIPLDYGSKELTESGCFLGSAAIVILSDKDDMKDVAINLLKFFEEESCGQCTPCRVGTEKTVKLMKEKIWNKEKLKDLSEVMSQASICGLGQAATNPLNSILKYFSNEIDYE